MLPPNVCFQVVRCTTLRSIFVLRAISVSFFIETGEIGCCGASRCRHVDVGVYRRSSDADGQDRGDHGLALAHGREVEPDRVDEVRVVLRPRGFTRRPAQDCILRYSSYSACRTFSARLCLDHQPEKVDLGPVARALPHFSWLRDPISVPLNHHLASPPECLALP